MPVGRIMWLDSFNEECFRRILANESIVSAYIPKENVRRFFLLSHTIIIWVGLWKGEIVR
jgi:hypothetical protein